MSESIEFHDSTLTSVAVLGTTILIGLRAYVHRWERVEGALKGTGWMQPIRIVLANAVGDTPSDLPLEVLGGEITAGQTLHDNLVPLPFNSSEPTRLLLVVARGALKFSGQGIAIEPNGEPTFIENLPDDFVRWSSD